MEKISVLFARQAENLLHEGDTENAVLILKKGIENNPSYAPGHSVLAAALLARGEKGKACEEFEIALYLDPQMPADLLMLGDLYVMQRRFAEAEQCFLMTSRFEPDSAELREKIEKAKSGRRVHEEEESRASESPEIETVDEEQEIEVSPETIRTEMIEPEFPDIAVADELLQSELSVSEDIEQEDTVDDPGERLRMLLENMGVGSEMGLSGQDISFTEEPIEKVEETEPEEMGIVSLEDEILEDPEKNIKEIIASLDPEHESGGSGEDQEEAVLTEEEEKTEESLESASDTSVSGDIKIPAGMPEEKTSEPEDESEEYENSTEARLRTILDNITDDDILIADEEEGEIVSNEESFVSSQPEVASPDEMITETDDDIMEVGDEDSYDPEGYAGSWENEPVLSAEEKAELLGYEGQDDSISSEPIPAPLDTIEEKEETSTETTIEVSATDGTATVQDEGESSLYESIIIEDRHAGSGEKLKDADHLLESNIGYELPSVNEVESFESVSGDDEEDIFKAAEGALGLLESYERPAETDLHDTEKGSEDVSFEGEDSIKLVEEIIQSAPVMNFNEAGVPSVSEKELIESEEGAEHEGMPELKETCDFSPVRDPHETLPDTTTEMAEETVSASEEKTKEGNWEFEENQDEKLTVNDISTMKDEEEDIPEWDTPLTPSLEEPCLAVDTETEGISVPIEETGKDGIIEIEKDESSGEETVEEEPSAETDAVMVYPPGQEVEGIDTSFDSGSVPENAEEDSLDSLLDAYVDLISSKSVPESGSIENQEQKSAQKLPSTAPSGETVYDKGPDKGPITATMAEIYASQGLFAISIELYSALLKNQPGNTRFQSRLAELRNLLENSGN